MPRKKVTRGKLRCSKCGKTFRLPMHLGRHMAALHGKARRKATKKRAAKAPRIRKGRPSGIANRLGLRKLSIDNLIALIDAAKAEAGRRLVGLRRAIQ